MSTATRAADAPDSPTDVPKRSWLTTLRRTIKEFQADNLTDWAAALTYYAILALFPALAALVSILGLVGDPVTTTNTLLDIVRQIAPQQVEQLEQPIADLTSKRSAAGLALIVSLALALWSASAYVGAFIRADNAIYEVEEGRPFWRLRPLQIVVTLVGHHPRGSRRPVPRRDRSGGGGGRRRDRPGRHGDHGLEHRQVARAAARGDHDHRDPVPRVAQREAARLPLGQPRRRRLPWSPGSSPPRCSPSTSRTSARTTRPTGRSRA